MSQEYSDQGENEEQEEQEIADDDQIEEELIEPAQQEDESQSNQSDQNEDNQDKNSWGTLKHNYYYKEKQDSDSEMEEEEVEEAQEVQAKLNQQLEFGNFFDGIELKKTTEEENLNFDENKIFQEKNSGKQKTIDLKNLSEEEKIEFLTKDSPELLSLLNESQYAIKELKQFYEPLFQNFSKLNIKNKKLKQFLKYKRETLLIYYQSLVFYVLLKAKNVLTKDHPILAQIIKLKAKNEELKQCELMFAEQLKSLKTKLKQINNSEKNINLNKPKKIIKKDQVIEIKENNQKIVKQAKKEKSNYKQQKLQKILNEVEDEQEEFRFKLGKQQKNKVSKEFNQNKFDLNILENDESSDEDNFDFDNIKLDKTKKKNKKELISAKQIPKISKDKGKFYKMEVNEEQGDEPRKIDKEILTHRGLIRKRKKIDRNSRVKLKVKFRKASVKQKYLGKVVRKKKPTYDGELTGIKSNLVKGVSLKN